MSILVELAPLLLGVLAGCLLCVLFTRTLRPLWALAAAVYFAADALVLLHAPPVRSLALQWNWTGKLASIVFSVVVLVSLRLEAKECGLVLPGSRAAWRWTAGAIVGCIALAALINWLFRDGSRVTTETYLYQLTMPGLDEELSFRGVGFALVDRAFADARGRWRGAPAVLVTTLVFGLVHGYSHDAAGSHMQWMAFLYAVILGLLFAITRRRSGSLLGPLVAHNGANVVGFIAGAL